MNIRIVLTTGCAKSLIDHRKKIIIANDRNV